MTSSKGAKIAFSIELFLKKLLNDSKIKETTKTTSFV